MEEVLVRFTATAEVAFGEDIAICGSVPALGSWSLSGAAALAWNEGGKWTAEVPLPCGVSIELKVVIRGQNGHRWLGTGADCNDNVKLETNLGRSGASPSRFLDAAGLPCGLQVEDLGEPGPHAAGPSTPQGGGPGTDMVPAGQQLACQGGVGGGSGGEPAAHVVAAQLAGQAAAHGCPVTYTTTTTTTTVVTMHGDASSSPVGAPQAMGPQIQYAQQPNGAAPQQAQQHHPSQHSAPNGGGGPQIVEIEDEDDSGGGACQRSAVDPEAVAKARAQNAGLPRMGCIPLAWRKPGASEVKIAGSWDCWVRQLALEPLPQGGFGIILALPRGEYECKFIVDGNWTHSEELEKSPGNDGNNNFSVDDVLIMPVMPSVTPALQDGSDVGSTAIVVA